MLLVTPAHCPCRQKMAQRLLLMKCGRIIAPVCLALIPLEGPGCQGHSAQVLAKGSWALAVAGTGTPEESHCRRAGRVAQAVLSQGRGLGLWVPISFSFPGCPHPVSPCEPVCDPRSQACFQKGPRASEPRSAPGFSMATGEQRCDLEIWGPPLTRVQECVPAAPWAWVPGPDQCLQGVFRASRTSPLPCPGFRAPGGRLGTE